MEPKFQTSFIPKKPIMTGGNQLPPKVRNTNLFSVIGTLIFVVALVASGGVFVYKNILLSQISEADQELNAARAAFQTEQIKDLINANARILSIKTLLENHVAISEILSLLEELTVKRLKFDDFTYINTGGLPTIAMTAEAKTYSTLASQSDIFSKNSFIDNHRFSDFSLVENGNIKAKFFTKIIPDLISYKKSMEASVPNE